jgi:hypothetical protein
MDAGFFYICIMKYIYFLIVFLWISFFTRAQIPVSQEPRHHKVMENEWVRVLDVHIPPGDTSLFHKHATPSVFILLSSAKSGSEVLQEDTSAHAVLHGGIWFETFYKTPRIHRVWNSDTLEFHVMDVELVHPRNGEIGALIRDKAFQLLFDEKPVRGYMVTLAGQSQIELPGRKSPVFIVDLKGPGGRVAINGQSFRKAGDNLFILPGEPLRFNNQDISAAELAFFELK